LNLLPVIGMHLQKTSNLFPFPFPL
jgi:hypothetical protein